MASVTGKEGIQYPQPALPCIYETCLIRSIYRGENILRDKKENALCGISGPLLSWYSENRRSLPWRDEPSAYHVWISEIMLQQTRVEAVKGYYARFLQRFPDIFALARADEDTILKLWEGLGYYSRARNLQRAARVLVTEYGGEMPRSAGELKKLPGIGQYTAAAVASIAFGEKIPAVDGNLLRVFSRLTLYDKEIRTPAALKAAQSFFLAEMPADHPGDFNQALMDLGAGICTPGGTPACGECPLRQLCLAAAQDRAAQLPLMPVKKARGIEKHTILVIRDDERILLRKRPNRGLLAGLYEFPNENGWLSEEEAVGKAGEYGCQPLHIRRLPDSKHVFTHKEWHMHGYEIRIGSFPGDAPAGGDCFTAEIREIQEKYALPSAYAAYLCF